MPRTVLYSTFLLYVIYYLLPTNTFSCSPHTLSALHPVTISAHGHAVHFVVAVSIRALLGRSLMSFRCGTIHLMCNHDCWHLLWLSVLLFGGAIVGIV